MSIDTLWGSLWPIDSFTYFLQSHSSCLDAVAGKREEPRPRRFRRLQKWLVSPIWPQIKGQSQQESVTPINPRTLISGHLFIQAGLLVLAWITKTAHRRGRLIQLVGFCRIVVLDWFISRQQARSLNQIFRPIVQGFWPVFVLRFKTTNPSAIPLQMELIRFRSASLKTQWMGTRLSTFH